MSLLAPQIREGMHLRAGKHPQTRAESPAAHAHLYKNLAAEKMIIIIFAPGNKKWE